MTELGHGVQVVTVDDDHSYQLNEVELEKILMSEKIKELPVAVVSVAGAYRGGKSFLLNFFLRYLSSPPSARQDGSWLGEESEPLTGFSWRGGSERNTTGILMWSEPFVIRISSGEKVAVLLMDTQGTFDSTSTVRDCSTIFALSTLLSSTQIYNLKDNIKEDDLQNLQLFTDYGALMKNQTGKAFQVLEFLIRDWQNPWEYQYGHVGGDSYLENKLKIAKKQPRELQELRTHIRGSFDKVTCFLMPHPGLGVTNPSFKGKISEIGLDFRNALKELASSIFSSETLSMKLLGGQPVKSRELYSYFKSYMSIFNSDTIPTPTTIFKATSEAGLLMAFNEARGQFEKNMGLACGLEAPSMPAVEVIDLHQRELAAARATFNAKKLLGDREVIETKLEELNTELNNRRREFIEINASKTMKAILKGIAAYEGAIATVTQGRQLCVHANDLKNIHKDAVEVALKAFGENRKIKQGQKDTDKDKLAGDLESKYTVLRLTNIQNNDSIIVEIKTEYFLYMVTQCNKEPKLSNEAFEEEHKKALARALDEFNSRRILPNVYTGDPFKYKLEQGILLQFSQLQQINVSNNKGSFQLALMVYNESILTLSEMRKHCLHPDDLKSDHENAMCQALLTYRNNTTNNDTCSIGFNESNKDEALLHSIFKNRYEAMADINATANEAAKETAFQAYKKKYDDLSDHWYWAFQSWDTAKKYHNEALAVGLEAFYGKRRDRNYHDSDSYLSDLTSRCEKYYLDS
ncbi:Atlastin-1 [Operophtera brumata]|uniref:Atlastin-1 n=1 Tax=Operophtera brumata TaxID=104452 RepID=A0A0L7LEK3_OPEBR|nr:Atlastin-1 [Operophtera brumata]